ncbi:iron ABC transporter permease [Cellulomonas sp. zg-ZUI199]|uniref:Iron ABC transporter permease n=1 Tax=Cellulomonas wangleii TaxID=2816956 RepID=A0ABX8D948_9CELL|nr:iron ABC transporter permease [Cellulomonas wangleii]QVI62582.1 iron ABC transporter permease [Cellulomonas wangleii]
MPVPAAALAVDPADPHPGPRPGAGPAGDGAPRRRGPRTGWGVRVAWAVAACLPLLFLAVFFVWPVAEIVGRGFVADGRLDLTGFGDVLTRPRTWRVVGQTLAQAGLGTLGAVLLGVPGAYLLYRCRFPGRGALRAFVTVPFVLPTVVVGVAFRSLLVDGGLLGGLGLDGSFAAIVLALVFFNYAVVVRTVGGLWERLDPRAEQAARALGASPWRVLRTVTLPALGPAIASAASLVFLFCATAFGTVLVLGGRRYGTVETEIWIQTTQFLDLRAAAVLSVVQLVVVVAALALAGRARARTEAAPTLGGTAADARPVRLRDPIDAVAVAVTALTVAGLLALPLVHLVVRSLRTPRGWGLDNYAALAVPQDTLAVSAWQAAGTSVRTAVDATVLALVVGGLVALLVSRRPRRTAARRAVAGLDALFMLPLGVSAVTVGFGFLVSMDAPLGLPVDLRTSPVLVAVAQAVVAVPLVVRTVLPVLRAVDPRQREVAATLGAAPGRVLRTVDLAVALRAVGLALGFAFAASLGEFGATSFLARPQDPTLPVVIFRLLGRPGAENYGAALAASVLLAALTASIVAVCERLRRPGTGGAW